MYLSRADRINISNQSRAEVDARLAELENRVKAEYERAAKEVEEKAKTYLNKFAKRDEQKRAQLRAGKITSAEYKQWRTGQIAVGKRWGEMKDVLATDLTNADMIARSIIAEYTPDAYAIGHSYGTYMIEADAHVDTSYTLYNRQAVEKIMASGTEKALLPPPVPGSYAYELTRNKAYRWNRRSIQSEIMQGILQGESMPEIAKRLRRVTDMDRKSAMRNARTAMVGAENAGHKAAYDRARALGIITVDQWLATLDSHTRAWHADMDGEKRDPDTGLFSNGLEYPGDPGGDPAEVYNCRCRLVTSVEGFERDFSDMSIRNVTKFEYDSYEEWKKDNHEKAERYRARKRAKEVR